MVGAIKAVFIKTDMKSAEVKEEGAKNLIGKRQEFLMIGKRLRVFYQRSEVGLPMNLVKSPDWGGLVWYWLPLLAYAMVIVYVSSLSVPKQELVVILNVVNAFVPAKGDIFSLINDKMYHVIEYALLAVLVYRALRYSLTERTEISIGLLTIVAVVLFGCSDEIHQWFVPLRNTEGWDLMADALGGLIGVNLWQCARSIPIIRFLEERIPLQLQFGLGLHGLKL